MRINPQQKLRDNLFYNNICMIVCIFCIICFATSLFFQNSTIQSKNFYNLKEGIIFGPINVTNTSQVYKIEANFHGNNTSTYLSGEVLDADKDTLYEFGKDLWHEDGYDSEGYWSESERKMTADLTFSEKGTYYIQFNTEENTMYNITLTIKKQSGSYVAHLEVGAYFLMVMLLIWCTIDKKWVKDKLSVLNDKLEEWTDED